MLQFVTELLRKIFSFQIKGNPMPAKKPTKKSKVFDRKKLLEDLRSDEGTINHAYRDHLGYWTIGTGRLIDRRRGGGITDEEAEYLLNNDVTRKEQELYKALPWLAEQPESVQRAVMNMSFQMGVEGVTKFKTTLGYIKKGDYTKAANNALLSKWARQTPARAKRVTDLIRSAKDNIHV